MSDIVERLRQQATVEAKKFGDARDIQIEWRAAEEIERLRARIKVLEELLRPLADAAAQYDPARDRDDHLEWSTRLTKGHLRKARAALEATP